MISVAGNSLTWRRVLCTAALTVALTAAGRAQTPADSSVSVTGPISGYMDFHYNKPEAQDGQLDFHRFSLDFIAILSHA